MKLLHDDAANDLLEWVFKQEIRGDGALAARRGETSYQNPHSYGSKEFTWWLEGFEDPKSCYPSPFGKTA